MNVLPAVSPPPSERELDPRMRTEPYIFSSTFAFLPPLPLPFYLRKKIGPGEGKKRRVLLCGPPEERDGTE